VVASKKILKDVAMIICEECMYTFCDAGSHRGWDCEYAQSTSKKILKAIGMNLGEEIIKKINRDIKYNRL
jgi:hypothetical protein